jgi:hypothetical protein
MDPDPPLSAAVVKSNNQLAAGMPKAGGGLGESIDDHTATTVGDDERQERARNDEGNNKDCVIGRLDMYHTKVLLYRTMVLLACPTKVRR